MQSLQRIIRANALFSAGSGGLVLVGAGLLDEVFGLESWLLGLVGISLISYGAALWTQSRRDNVRPLAKLAAMLDIDWVIAAAVILIGFPTAMTTAGRVALLGVSLVVAVFAAEQIVGLRRTDHATAADSPASA